MPKYVEKQTLLCFLVTLLTACSQDTELYNGYVEARLTYLSSPYGGKLEELTVPRGSKVLANETLFTLDTKPESIEAESAQAQIEEAIGYWKDLQTGKRPSEIDALQAQIKQIQKELNFAQTEYNRYQALLEKGAVARQIYDQAVKNYFTTKARLENLQAELTTAKLPARSELITAAKARVNRNQDELSKANWAIEQKIGKSPQDGYIYDTYYRVGEYVPANHPVISLITPDEINVIFYIPEIKLSQLVLGQTVLVNCDGCLQEIPAQVTYISQIAEYTPPVIYSQKTRTKLVFRVEADLQSNQQKLLPGQPVDVRVKQSK